MKTLRTFILLSAIAAAVLLVNTEAGAADKNKKSTDANTARKELLFDGESLAKLEKQLIEECLATFEIADSTVCLIRIYNAEGDLCFEGEECEGRQQMMFCDFLFRYGSVSYYLADNR